jgi:hypothetical protein
MKNNIWSLLLLVFIVFEVNAQKTSLEYKKNSLFFQANYHLEKRGSDNYSNSNPDFAFSYERKLFGFGDNRILSGIRTGAYREYVLTGNGWSHPTKTRFFLGASASYMYETSTWFKIQVTLLTDVLLPDDYEETWSYWAIEPSVYFVFYKNMYVGLTATMGSFLFFDPRADFDKAGVRFGFFF